MLFEHDLEHSLLIICAASKHSDQSVSTGSSKEGFGSVTFGDTQSS